jgi:hypothetical protein
VERFLHKKKALRRYTVLAHHTVGAFDEIDAVLDELGLVMEEVAYDRVNEDRLRLSFSVMGTAESNRNLRERLIRLKNAIRVESPRPME